MFPLLALGLLAGGAYAQQAYKDRRQEQLAEGVTGLLGAPGQMPDDGMGPPTQGTGLMADPADIGRQMQFAQGLMRLPGGPQALQAFEPMLGRAIQSKQFQQQEARAASQWGAEFEQREGHWKAEQDRLTEQFKKEFGLREQEAAALAAQRVQDQKNWQATFDQNAREAAERRRMEGERLRMERERLGYERGRYEREGRAEPVKLPAGYGFADVPGVGRVAVPAPGTEPYAKAVSGDRALGEALSSIDSLMDEYLGPETTVNGERVRSGGAGSEWWGPSKASMAGKRGAIIAAVGAMRDAGVLQEGEYKRFEEQLPNIDEVFPNKKTWEAGYREIRRQFAAKQKSHRAANPWLTPPPPPGFH